MRRALACLAIAVYAMGQWSAVVHNAVARHIRCAEHGELVELRAVATGLTHNPALATLLARSDDTPDHGEEHCAFATSLRPLLAAGALATSVLDAPRLVCSPATPPAAVPHPLAPLIVAPKTSPPPSSSAVSSQLGFHSHTDEVLVCVRPSSCSVSRSLAAPPWCTATSVPSSTRRPVA